MGSKILAAGVVALAVVAFSLPAGAAELKIGAVNLPLLVQTSPQAKQARERMKKKFSAEKQKLEDRKDKLQNNVQRLKRDGSVMSDDAREQLAAQIRDKSRHLKLDMSVYQENVKKAERDEMKKLRGVIGKVINDFAKKNDYDLMLASGVIYANDTINVTDQILDLLKDQQ